MSDTIANSIIGGVVTIILGAFHLIGIRMMRATNDKVARIEHNTNGMQATIEKLAYKAGQTEERDREKP